MMKKQTKRLKNQAGFTIVEVVVVTVILGALAAMFLPTVMTGKGKADGNSDIALLTSDAMLHFAAQGGFTTDRLCWNNKPYNQGDNIDLIVKPMDKCGSVASRSAGRTSSGAGLFPTEIYPEYIPVDSDGDSGSGGNGSTCTDGQIPDGNGGCKLPPVVCDEGHILDPDNDQVCNLDPDAWCPDGSLKPENSTCPEIKPSFTEKDCIDYLKGRNQEAVIGYCYADDGDLSLSGDYFTNSGGSSKSQCDSGFRAIASKPVALNLCGGLGGEPEDWYKNYSHNGDQYTTYPISRDKCNSLKFNSGLTFTNSECSVTQREGAMIDTSHFSNWDS